MYNDNMAKFMQTVAAMACIKTLLMIFNLAFWVSVNSNNKDKKRVRRM